MNIRLSARRALLSLAGCAGLALVTPAQAAYNGQLLRGDEIPGWVMGDENGCSATVISTTVILVTPSCANYGYGSFFQRKTGNTYSGQYELYPFSEGVIGNVGLLFINHWEAWLSLQSAPIASYQEEKEFLVDGNATLTQGTRLVSYMRNDLGAIDVEGRRPGTARLVHSHLYFGPSASDPNEGFPNGRPLIYRTLAGYRQSNPYQTDNAVRKITEHLGPFTDRDVDDIAILTIGLQTDPEIQTWTPFINQQGAGLFLQKPDGALGLIGSTFEGTAQVRLSYYWPWIVQMLQSHNRLNEAIQLSDAVLGTSLYTWPFRRLGQIYTYINGSDIQYFRLASPESASSEQYDMQFPTNRRDNRVWEYLGTTLPNFEQATTPINAWNGQSGKAGDVYIYANPYTGDVEYFQLKVTGRYGYFPVNKTSNWEWDYKGTDLPTRALKSFL